MTVCPNCKIEYDENSTAEHHCLFTPQIDATGLVIHPEWAFDIKISNENTKCEKRVTIHVRGDIDPKELAKKAHELYVEELGS